MTRRANRDLPFNKRAMYGMAVELESLRASVGMYPEAFDQAAAASIGLYGLAYGDRRLISRRTLERIHQRAASEATPYTPQTYEQIDDHYARLVPDAAVAQPPAEDWR